MARIRSKFGSKALSYGDSEDVDWKEGQSFAGFFTGSRIVQMQDGRNRTVLDFVCAGAIDNDDVYVGKRGKKYNIFATTLLEKHMEESIPVALADAGLPPSDIQEVCIIFEYQGKHPLPKNKAHSAHRFDWSIDDEIRASTYFQGKGNFVNNEGDTNPTGHNERPEFAHDASNTKVDHEQHHVDTSDQEDDLDGW